MRAPVVILASGNATSWSAIVLAVLGSSAVGAVVGGYITTRLRGNIERDEAWRTRLVEAADAFLAQLGRTVNSIPHGWLVAIEQDQQDIRLDGVLTPVASQVIADFDMQIRELFPLVSRVKLLFGAEAGQHAGRAVRIIANAGDVLRGAAWVATAMAEENAAIKLGINEQKATNLDAEEFDSDDDSSIAMWTRELVESVPPLEKKVFEACRLQIESRRPSQSGR